MTYAFSTARERRSTFVFACPTLETVNKIKDYTIRNEIPNAAGFRPNPYLHITLLRNAKAFNFPWPDIHHYHRTIRVITKGRAPNIIVPHHKHFCLVGISLQSEFFARRRQQLHDHVGMRVDPKVNLHLMLSYWAPVKRWRLPAFDFDLEFDVERISDLMAWVRPRELHEEIYREKRQMAQVRSAELRRGL